MSVERTDASTNAETSELSQDDLNIFVGGIGEDTGRFQQDRNNSNADRAYGYKSIGRKIQQEFKDAGLW